MPHCILEYTENVPDQPDSLALFAELHLELSKLGYDLEKLKSRAIKHSQYLVGDGAKSNGFVYLQIAILSGRPLELRENTAKTALEIVRSYFPLCINAKTISMTVEVREVDRDTHQRLIRES